MTISDKKRMILKMVCLLIAITMTIESLGSLKIAAASKATLSTKSATIAVNKKAIISLKNKAKGAKYTYKSKNVKIASVSNKGVVVGKGFGKTTITVLQNLKGKTSKIGIFKINVAKSKLNIKNIEMFAGEVISGKDFIDYYNTKAKYKITSNKSSVVKASVTGNLKAVGEGTATIVVKETFNGKLRTVGRFTVEVIEDEDYEEDEDYDEDYYEDEDYDDEDYDEWEE